MNRKWIAWLLAASLCACSAPSSERQIRDLIKSLASAAEDESIGPFRKALRDDYQDLRDNDKKAALNLLRGAMLRTDDVLIFTDVEAIRFMSADFAEVEVKARFAGADWERLQLRGSVYLFELEVTRDGNDWQIATARWAHGDDAPR